MFSRMRLFAKAHSTISMKVKAGTFGSALHATRKLKWRMKNIAARNAKEWFHIQTRGIQSIL